MVNSSTSLTIKKKIEETLKKIVKKDIPVTIEVPKDPSLGDYSTNLALRLAKQEKINPNEVAKRLVSKIEKADFLEKIEEKNGFINFWLSKDYLQKQVLEILKQGEDFGQSSDGKDLKVLVEFVSANPTGPLTLGNGRGGFAGDVLAEVFRMYGCQVHREYYVNDRGTQVENLGKSVLAAVGKYQPQEDDQLYKGEYVKDLASKIKVDTTDPKIIGERAALEILENYIKPSLQKLKIPFDDFFLENSLYQRGEVEKIMGILEKKKLLYKKEGATWIATSKLGSFKDDVLIKENGEYTYFASDIAYHFHKLQRGYNLLVNFFGADHGGHAPRLRAVVEEVLQPNLEWGGEIVILINQLVRLVSQGKEFKISKRAGTFVTLDDLVSEVGLDATRFLFLMHDLNTHLDFDLELAKQKSLKNPVYYVQYAHARVSSILRKAPAKNIALNKIDTSLLSEEAELDLIKRLVRFPEIIEEIAQSFQVQKLPYYLLDLATSFHNFYEKVQVISSDTKLTSARIALIKACQIILRKNLKLLKIQAPEKM